MKSLHVKKGDTVIVISGDDRKNEKGENTIAKVMATSPEEGKVIVEGVNVVSKHQKPRRQGEAGGIMKVEGAIYADKVQLFCEKCGKATRVAHKVNGDKKVRVCVKCGAEL